MKSPFPKGRETSRGSALILTLTGTVLVTLILLAFLANVKTESKISSYYTASAKAVDLADSALNVAQACIQNGSKTSAGEAWTSQPGLIRVFDSTGNQVRWRALYSTLPIQGDGKFVASQHAVPADWASKEEEYVDLNKPVNGIYPIADPAAFNGDIEGATLGMMPGVDPSLHPLPMPVQWLYLLSDGSMVSADEARGSSKEVQGRVAFWTDDETSKVNINTASEGNFWDTPRLFTTYERDNLAQYQPTLKEYQRYPGHPATTSLSAVLGKWLPSPDTVTPANYVQLREYYKITPGVNDTKDGLSTGAQTGSKGGTAKILTTSTDTILPDSDRLYVSVDELFYDPLRTKNFSALNAATIEKTRFFLTSNSQAPETTLFGTPRISIWPVFKNLDPTKTTIFDRLIAFCSTVGGKAYYFQREDPYSPTNDYDNISRNQDLYSYLQRLTSTPIPGFGEKTFLMKYGTDRDQILTEILDYIRCTNLNDDGLNYDKRYAMGKPKPVTSSDWTKAIGFGQVAPLRIGSTMGFGRFLTVAEPIIMASRLEKIGTKKYGGALSVQDRIQLTFLMTYGCVALGDRPTRPGMKVRISGLSNLRVNGNAVNFPNDNTYLGNCHNVNMNASREKGGLQDLRVCVQTSASIGGVEYPYISGAIDIPAPAVSPNFVLSQVGDIVIELYSDSGAALTAANIYTAPVGGASSLVQTIHVNFPQVTLPVPEMFLDSATPQQGTMVSDVIQRLKDNNTVTGSTGGLGLKRAGVIQLNPNAPYAGDVVRNLYVQDGDLRLAAGRQTVSSTLFKKSHSDYDLSTVPIVLLSRQQEGGIVLSSDGSLATPSPDYGNPTLKYIEASTLASGLQYCPIPIPLNTHVLKGVPTVPQNGYLASERYGDFDNGVGYDFDGPWINKPDEGNTQGLDVGEIPYFTDWEKTDSAATYFTPNRIMPSAGMFGSLSSGIKAEIPWKTLLFRPQSTHPGATAPADHLLLDLFWMPVVEPYPISSPLATSGKINMNYQIIPFTYIKRATGLHAVLKKERILAIQNADTQNDYKNPGVAAVNVLSDRRMDLDVKETLRQFDTKFEGDDVFRSASEICDLHLVPKTKTLENMSTFWSNYKPTGDNSREKPYAVIYPRLTTRSNTFSVHVWAQSIQKVKDQSKFQVLGEYRGHYNVERYVDPADPTLPDFAPLSSARIEDYYKVRMLNRVQFNP